MKTMLQITRSGMVFSGSDADIELARAHFEQHDWIRFPAILDRELWNMLQQQLAASNFEGSIYQELNVGDSALLLLLNNAQFFKIIQQITGCVHIGCFRGRTYRIVPGADYYALLTHDQTAHEILTGWHTDLNGTKLVALSINLNTEPYQGGVLSIREAKTRRLLCELTNSGFGDAILFRIDERLEHRVSDVKGTVAKTAFSGWFESEPDYRTLLAAGVARSLRKAV
ncbi:MAG: 2OG-Fe(II) oxygenase [Acidobacteriota bacterium]|nr:2OG-Fe(II) oxygenase [Acidobacteriota bacterium]